MQKALQMVDMFYPDQTPAFLLGILLSENPDLPPSKNPQNTQTILPPMKSLLSLKVTQIAQKLHKNTQNPEKTVKKEVEKVRADWMGRSYFCGEMGVELDIFEV